MIDGTPGGTEPAAVDREAGPFRPPAPVVPTQAGTGQGRRARPAAGAVDLYPALVEQAPDAIVVLDVASGRFVSVNRAAEQLFGMDRTSLLEVGLLDVSPPTQPDGRLSNAALASRVQEAVGGDPTRFDWASCRPDGGLVTCEVTLVRLPSTDGLLIRGGLVDVTGRREAQRIRETAARNANEAGAARLQAMVAGLNAIVWERDPVTWRSRFVNERAEDLLGYPVAEWLADADLWPRILHPDDREAAVEGLRQGIAAGRDFALTYRVRTADGRLVWLHHLAHVAQDDAGAASAVHSVLVDITERTRREQAAEMLAAAGQLLAAPGTVEERLSAVAGLAVGALSDRSSVWLRENDGRYRAVAAAPAESADQVLALAPVTTPPELEAAYLAGRPFIVAQVDDEMRREATQTDEEFSAVAALRTRRVLVAPLVNGGRVVGALTLVITAEDRGFDDADLALAGELGQRIATMVAAEQVAARERDLHAITVALSGAGTVVEAATELSAGLRRALGAGVVVVYTLGEDSLLHLVHATGYPRDRLDRYRTVRLGAELPITEAVRTGRPVLLPDRDAWARRFPSASQTLLEQSQAGVALPLTVGGRVLGVVGASFPTRREFDPGERTFLLTMAGQAAVAFERAALADLRREIADTLQHSLLPRSLPAVDRLSVTARYVSGATGTQAGGDWYDVLPLEGRGVALVVGDVVGNGAPAAAVMGQLRSALAAVLLEGHSPARALELLDGYAAQVDGAQVSTVACLLLDTGAGRLTYSRAGHPPPLVLDAVGARFLDAGWGPALGLPGGQSRTEATTTLTPGETLVLYTDGLIERRGATLDDGLAALARVGAAVRADHPSVLVESLLGALVADVGPADDIAVVAARLLPAPLRLELPANPYRLRQMRLAIASWAADAALDPAAVDDLQLAVGEAVANAVEHAYRTAGPGGTARLEVRVDAAEDLRVTVTDGGSWRPPPTDPGFRGRGLQMIGRLATDVHLSPGPDGTSLTFVVPGRSSRPARPPDRPAPEPADVPPAAVRIVDSDGEPTLCLVGDLDLEGVAAARDALLDAFAATDPPRRLDLTDVGHLSSIGMGLLLELTRSARQDGRPLEVVLPEDGAARRALDLAGLADALSDP